MKMKNSGIKSQGTRLNISKIIIHLKRVKGFKEIIDGLRKERNEVHRHFAAMPENSM